MHGLAHITGDGLLNLLRLNADVGFEIDDPLPPQPIFGLIQERGERPGPEMWEVFNMGTGFCCVVAAADAERSALELLAAAISPGDRRGDRRQWSDPEPDGRAVRPTPARGRAVTLAAGARGAFALAASAMPE